MAFYDAPFMIKSAESNNAAIVFAERKIPLSWPRLKIEMAAEARLAWAYLPYENDDAAYYVLFRDGMLSKRWFE